MAADKSIRNLLRKSFGLDNRLLLGLLNLLWERLASPYTAPAKSISGNHLEQKSINLRPLIYVEARILELSTQLGHVDIHFVLCPGLGRAELGEQPHAPALHAGHPVLEVDRPGLLVLPIAGPGPDGPLVRLFLDIHEPDLADGLGHGVGSVAVTAGTHTTARDGRAPAAKDVVLWQELPSSHSTAGWASSCSIQPSGRSLLSRP